MGSTGARSARTPGRYDLRRVHGEAPRRLRDVSDATLRIFGRALAVLAGSVADLGRCGPCRGTPSRAVLLTLGLASPRLPRLHRRRPAVPPGLLATVARTRPVVPLPRLPGRAA